VVVEDLLEILLRNLASLSVSGALRKVLQGCLQHPNRPTPAAQPTNTNKIRHSTAKHEAKHSKAKPSEAILTMRKEKKSEQRRDRAQTRREYQ